MTISLIIAVMHTTQAVVKIKPPKKSGLNGIGTMTSAIPVRR